MDITVLQWLQELVRLEYLTDPSSFFFIGFVHKKIGKFFVEEIWGPIADVATEIFLFVETLLEKIGGVFEEAALNIWRNVGYPIVEYIFNALGFVDETIELTEVIVIKLLDETPKHSLSTSITSAILNDQDIIENIKNTMLTSAKNSANLYKQYGVSSYIHGLPTVNNGHVRLDKGETDSIITAIEGQAITLGNTTVGAANNNYWVRYYLQENEGFTEDDNIITLTGVDWIYDGFTIDGSGNFDVDLVKETGGTPITGTNDFGAAGEPPGPPTPYQSFMGDSTKTWVVGSLVGDVLYNETKGLKGTIYVNNVDVAGARDEYDNFVIFSDGDLYRIEPADNTTLGYLIPPSLDENYVQVQYTLDATPTYNKHWVYLISSGTYPNLDAHAFDDEFLIADMLPIIPIIENFVSIDSDAFPGYATSTKILDILGLDIHELISNLDDSPNRNDIRAAFFLFGIPLFSSNEQFIKATYGIFHNLHANAHVTKAIYDANPAGEPAKFNLLTIKEQKYNTALKYNYITKTDVVGSVIPDYTFDIVVTVLADDSYEEQPDGTTTGGGVNSYVTIRHQYSATNYEVLVIHGVFMMMNVLTVTGTIHSKLIPLSTDPLEMDKFLLPLPHFILNGGAYSHDEGEALIYETMHMVIYAASTTELEWYETSKFLGFFKLILAIASVIVIIVTWGGATPTISALWTTLAQLLVHYGLTIALELALKEYAEDDDAKVAIYIAYITASIFAGNRFGGGLTGVEALLFGVNALSTAVNIDISLQAEDLNQEYTSWIESTEERQEELDKAQAYLDNNTGLEPWEIVTHLPTNPYESPNDYYNRTAHIANPGVLVFSELENYTKNMLKLPELVVEPESTDKQ